MAQKSPVKAKPDDPEQSKRFIETAREVGADEQAEAFDQAFKAITSPPRTRPDLETKKPAAKHPKRA